MLNQENDEPKKVWVERKETVTSAHREKKNVKASPQKTQSAISVSHPRYKLMLIETL